MRAIPACASEFVREHEACVLRVYDDARPNRILKPGDMTIGTLTAGYGHTGASLEVGMPVTQAMADQWLDEDLAQAAGRLARLVKAEVLAELTPHQYGALLSFVFNVGADGDWTIWKRLNARAFDQVPQELMRFVNSKGRKVDGLVNRRAAEVVFWSTAEPGTLQSNPPSSITRAAPTPPTPSDPTPPGKSAMLLTSATAAIAAGPPMVNQAMQAIQPYAQTSETVKRMLGVLAALGAALAVAGLVLMWLHKRQARS